MLAEELKRRHITNSSEIVIISEYDTEKILKLANNFNNSISRQFDSDKSSKECKANEMGHYTYLKGLDAYQRMLGKQNSENSSKALEKREELLSVMDQHNLPIGPAQFDYLYRLVRQIKESHKDNDHKKHIKAVGVFGSDFYDKLVIFQALRAEIPNIVLFTTELDAEMLHPQYWRWTRNLIVATPFDLRLNDKFQKQTPPFRDSLQTQIYYEIRKVLSSLDGESPSLIFEIGRNGPVYLTTGNGLQNESESVHPDYSKQKNQLNNQLILWSFIVIALIFTVQQIKPHSGAIVIWLSTTAIVLFTLAFYAANWPGDEPFGFTDGVSMWPSILLRWFAFSLAAAFIFLTIRSLEANFDRLNRRYYSAPADGAKEKLIALCKDEKQFSGSEVIGKLIPKCLKDFWKKLKACLLSVCDKIRTQCNNDHHKSNTKNKQSIFSFEFVSAILIIAIAIIIYAFGIHTLFQDPELLITLCVNYVLEIALLLILTFGALYFENKIKSIRIMVEKDAVRTPKSNCDEDEYKGEDLDNKRERTVIPSDDLWKEYYIHGRLRHRLLRASLKFSIFMIVAALLYQLFPTLPPPCRGDSCIFWEETSRVLSFSIIMLLTFLVLDAQRLCLHWIEKIRTKHLLFVDKTPEKKTRESGDDLDRPLAETGCLYESDGLYKKLKSLNKELTVRSVMNTYTAKKSLEDLEDQLAALEKKCKNLEDLSVLEKLRSKLETLKAKVLPAYAQENPAVALKSFQDIVTLVAKRTRVVDRLIYYPLIAIMLLLIARMSYFDNIAFPLHISFTVIMSISLLLYAGAKLRIEAIQLKRAAINCAKYLSHPDKETVIREIQGIDYGAFEPLFEQPAIRSLLLTLGFLGLIISEYFTLFG